jgi:hypothetical protein
VAAHCFPHGFDIPGDGGLTPITEARRIRCKSRKRRFQSVSQIGGAAAGPFDLPRLRINECIDFLDEGTNFGRDRGR